MFFAIQKSGATPEAIQRFKKMGDSSVFWFVESPSEAPVNRPSESPLNVESSYLTATNDSSAANCQSIFQFPAIFGVSGF